MYGSAHRPLPNGAQDDVGYMTGAERRERWTVQFMLNAIDRYAPAQATDLALDAGCGSGGSLGWLAERYSEMLRPAGAAYVLTPNKWNLVAREPHVKLWGIQLLPRALADRYCRWRIGIRYSTVACLLSSRQVAKVLDTRPGGVVRFVPIEDKHLNPRSRRGRFLKSWFDRRPLSWLSRAVRPVQPVLEAILIRDMRSSPPP